MLLANESFFNQWDFFDLTHPISNNIPVWPDDPSIQIEEWATIEKDGYALNQLIIGEHSGTHIGCPGHFLLGGRRIDQYGPKELILPASVISIVEKIETNSNYALTLQDIREWEAKYGRLSEGQLLLIFTNWSGLWANSKEYLGIDNNGVPHFPGISSEVVSFLVEKRKIAGLGIDTHGIDKGSDSHFEANRLLFEANCFHLENLVNLEKLPTKGSILFIGALPILNGTGSPARVMALVQLQD